MTIQLAESRAFAEAAAPAVGPGRLLIQLITPGLGSSGYYSPEVVEAAAKDRVWPAGTHMFVDHPSESENYDRPERTVKDLAAVLTEDARWDPAANDGTGALVAEARVFSQWRQPLAEMADSIGVSIRGTAEGEMGEVNGRQVQIFTRLVEGLSVDFVTRAGRGGKVLQVLESARPVREARNVGQWVESRIHRDFTVLADDMAGDGRLTREERIALSSAIGDGLAAFVAKVEATAPQLYERDLWDEPPGTVRAATEAAVRRGVAEATANDRREQLQTLVKDEYGGADVWPWVRDFDDESVWFDIDGGDDGGTFQQGYELTGDVATALTGDRTEVRVQTQYLPVGEADQTTGATPAPVREAATAAEPTPPAVEAGTTPPHKKEDPMGTIQVDEARYAGLEEKAAIVPALEAKVTAAEARADAAESERDQAVAASKARDFARKLASEANKDLVSASLDAIVAEATRNPLPLDAERRLDTEKFSETVNEARTAHETLLASIAEASGIGTVRGLGATESTSPLTVADAERAVAEAFGRTPKEA